MRDHNICVTGAQDLAGRLAMVRMGRKGIAYSKTSLAVVGVTVTEPEGQLSCSSPTVL
jgi:hypothetical protein